MIKVSVIVPVYNGEKTIKSCIESLLSQTLTDLEIIVVNDGSTDGTMDIVSEFSDNRIKSVTTPNQGQGLARNCGIRVASGEYVGFCDADDTVDATMYEKLYNVAKENRDDMVQCAIKDIRNGTASIRSGIDHAGIQIDSLKDYLDSYFYTLLHTNEVCNKMFRRSFLEENSLKFSDTKKVFSEDLDLNIRILPHLRRVSFISDALYNYYISDTGHCKRSPYERIDKIFTLYKNVTKDYNAQHFCTCIKSMAVITVLSYCVGFTYDPSVKSIICSKTMKSFMLSSIKYRKNISHSLLMLALILAPYNIKAKIIESHYRF
ncbi:MAG: glycosyltransferase [Ruminococcaceae bacterium]|nr:glycosyltransferase [Oscillospiraceae bacterium]